MYRIGVMFVAVLVAASFLMPAAAQEKREPTPFTGFLTDMDGNILLNSGNTFLLSRTEIKIEGQWQTFAVISGNGWDSSIDVQMKCFVEDGEKIVTTIQQKTYYAWFRDDLDTDLPPDGIREERYRKVTVTGDVCSGVVTIDEFMSLWPDQSYGPDEMKVLFNVDPHQPMKIYTCPEHVDSEENKAKVVAGIKNAKQFLKEGGEQKTYWDFLAEATEKYRNWLLGFVKI